jgi:arsenate reductase
MIYVLHYNRCTKSRNALALLEEYGIPYETVNYLNGILSTTDIKELLVKLELSPQNIVRKTEAIYKENYKGQTFSDTAWIKILQENPELIERPIVYNESAAVVGRPIENIKEFIKTL